MKSLHNGNSTKKKLNAKKDLSQPFLCIFAFWNQIIFKIYVFLLFLLERLDGFVKKCTLYRVESIIFKHFLLIPLEEECM